MAESPRRVDLQLTIPTAAPYADIAGEIASRFASYSGASRADAAAIGRAVDAVATRARAAAADSITFDLSVTDQDLTVDSNVAGRTERLSYSLSS